MTSSRSSDGMSLSPHRSPKSPKDMNDVVVDLISSVDELMKHSADSSPPKDQHVNLNTDPALLEEDLAADLTSNFDSEPVYFNPPSVASQVKDSIDSLTISVANIQDSVKELTTSDAKIVANQEVFQTNQESLQADVMKILEEMVILKNKLDTVIEFAAKVPRWQLEGASIEAEF